MTIVLARPWPAIVSAWSITSTEVSWYVPAGTSMVSPALDALFASRSEQSPGAGSQEPSLLSTSVLTWKVVAPWAGAASASATNSASGGRARPIRIGAPYPPNPAYARPLIPSPS